MPGRLVSRGRGRQPAWYPALDRLHPLGVALDHLYSAAHPGGHDLIGGLLAPPPAGVTVSPSAEAVGWVATGAAGTNKTISGVNRFPIVLFGYGRFADASNSWRLSPMLQSSGTGYLAGIRLASSTDVSLVVQFNFGTTRTIAISLPTALNVPIAAIAVIYSATDYRLFVNGKSAVGTLSPGTLGAFDLASPPAGTFYGRLWSQGYGCGRAVPDAAALDLTANPEKLWRMFRSPLRRLFLSGGGALSGAASGGAQAGGAANASVQVALAGVGVAVAGGSAQAQVAVPLSAAAIAQAGGGATATATVTLSAAGLAQAAGAAGLDVAAVLAAAGSAQAGGSATLSGGAPGALSAAGAAQAGGAAVLTVTVTLAAAGGAQAGGSATISGGSPGALSASGGAQAGGVGTLVATVQLTAAGLAQALGAGQLAVQVPLAAFAAAVAGGSATLVDLAAIALLKDHRWSVAGNRVWRVRRARKLSVGRSRHAQ